MAPGWRSVHRNLARPPDLAALWLRPDDDRRGGDDSAYGRATLRALRDRARPEQPRCCPGADVRSDPALCRPDRLDPALLSAPGARPVLIPMLATPPTAPSAEGDIQARSPHAPRRHWLVAFLCLAT